MEGCKIKQKAKEAELPNNSRTWVWNMIYGSRKAETTHNNIDLFGELRERQIELKKDSGEKRKDFQLKIFTGMISNGHIKDLGGQLNIYLFLTPKTTKAVEDSSGQIWYLIYGGRYTDIIEKIAKYFGICKPTVWYHLQLLEQRGYIAVNAKPGEGTAVALRKIHRAYDRRKLDKGRIFLGSPHSNPTEQLLKDTEEKSNSAEELFDNTKELIDNTEQVLNPSNKGIANKHKAISESRHSESRHFCLHNQSNKESTKENTTTTDIDAVASEILKILNEQGKGRISLNTIKDKIKGKDPAKIKAYALMAAEKARANVPGYWLKLVEEEPDIELEEKDTYQPPGEYAPWVTETDNYPWNRLSIEVRKEIVRVFGRDKGHDTFIEIIEQFGFLEHRGAEELTPEKIQKIRDFIKKKRKQR